MPGLFTGAVSWRPRGDLGRCMALQGQARAWIQWLFETIEQGGARQPWGLRHHTWILPDAVVRITVLRDLRGHKTAWCDIQVTDSPPATPDSAVVTTSLTLILQHGLEVLDLSALVSDPTGTTSQVYPGAALEAIYGGAGWSVPDSDPAWPTHWVGQLRATSDGGAPPTWAIDFPREGTVDPPTLTSGAHPGLFGAGPAALDYLATANGQGGYVPTRRPSEWTGLARAWLEACRGAGMTDADLADRLPAGWSVAPGCLGLVQDPTTKTYWALNADILGLTAHRMTVSDATAQVAGWLADGTLTGDAARLATAYVLADLRIDSTAETLTLINAETMAPVYAGQGTTVDPTYTVFVEDSVPSGATSYIYPTGGDQWSWVTASPPPHSGSQSHKSLSYSGMHQHYFSGATAGVAVGVGDTIVQWIWIPATNGPREIMLSFNDGTNFEHRAYWGENLIVTGTNGTDSCRYIGAIPSDREQWVLLETPAYLVGMEGKTLKGVAYTLYDSWAAWDYTAVRTVGASYAEGNATPFQTGWAFSPTAAKGAIVTERTVNPGEYWQASESAQSTFEITWTDGVPTATLSLGTFARFRPHWGYHKFWYGSGGIFNLLRHGQLWPGNSDCSASAPVTCWYDGSTLVTWNYYKAESVPAGANYNTTYQCNCTGDGSQITYSSGLSMVRGGYGVSAPTPVISGTGTVTKWEGSISGATPGNWFQIGGDTGTTTFNYWHSGTNNGGCGNNVNSTIISNEWWAWVNANGYATYPWTTIHANRWQRNTEGTAVGVVTVDTYTGAGFSQVLVYDITSPDVLWERTIKSATAFSTQIDTYTRGHVVTQQEIKQDSTAKNIQTGQTVFWEGVTYTGQPLHCFGLSPMNPCGDDPNTLWNPNIIGLCSAHTQETTNGTGAWALSAKVHVGVGEISVDGSASVWDGAPQGNGLEPAEIAVSANISARGALLYTPEPSADVEAYNWDSSVPERINSSAGTSVAWVGAT